jgi:hypothetical protein
MSSVYCVDKELCLHDSPQPGVRCSLPPGHEGEIHAHFLGDDLGAPVSLVWLFDGEGKYWLIYKREN